MYSIALDSRRSLPLAPVVRWLGAAAVLRLEVFVLAAAEWPPLWRGRAFALLVARTFLLLFELNRPVAPTTPRWTDHLTLPLAHFAFVTFAALAASRLGADAPLSLALLIIAAGLWLTMTTPLSQWRRAHVGVLVAATAVGLLATVGSWITRALWLDDESGVLAATTLNASYFVLHAIEPQTTVDASTFGLGARGFHVTVAASCAGASGMALVFVFLTAYLVIFRRTLRFPRAFILLPLGLAAVWSLNVVRIAALVLIGAHGWPEVAVNGFHSRAGWLAFNGVAIGFAAIGRTKPFLLTEERKEQETINLTAPFLLPLLAVLATSLVTEAMSAGFDRFYGARVLVVLGVLWNYRDSYARLKWKLSSASLVGGLAVFALWVAIARMGGGKADSIRPALALLPAHVAAIWIGFRVIGSVVIAPIAEELAFRAWLPRRLQRREFEEIPMGAFTLPALALSSFAFGLLHGMWLAGIVAGAIYAWVLSHRRSVGDAIAAHALTNGLLCVYALASGDWSLL